MAGNNMKIAKQTVRLLVQTFHQNDFINIIYFNESGVQFLIPCQRNLMQATQSNKDRLLKALEKLPNPGGEIFAYKCFQIAFDILKRSTVDNIESSGCNRMIMFISDGVEHDSMLHDVVQKNNAEKNVRIFPILVGISKFKDQMQQIACENRGALINVATEGR